MEGLRLPHRKGNRCNAGHAVYGISDTYPGILCGLTGLGSSHTDVHGVGWATARRTHRRQIRRQGPRSASYHESRMRRIRFPGNPSTGSASPTAKRGVRKANSCASSCEYPGRNSNFVGEHFWARGSSSRQWDGMRGSSENTSSSRSRKIGAGISKICSEVKSPSGNTSSRVSGTSRPL